jgi:hypothetical protein
MSTLFSLRNRVLVATDWMKVKLFGRYVALLSPLARLTDEVTVTLSETKRYHHARMARCGGRVAHGRVCEDDRASLCPMMFTACILLIIR